MVSLTQSGVWLYNGKVYETKPADIFADERAGRRGTIAARILRAHDISSREEEVSLVFDSLTSHDITYVGILQTARACGMERFPMPYVLTNCHNSLCAVGGTINADDHMYALSAAKKYGGVYVPENLAVIHTYNREMMAGCGRMILGSDSHTRYGALGTLGVGEGGGELVKQLLGKTWDAPRPQVVLIYLTGAPRPGVGPQDVALSIIGATYENGYVKNKIMEFVGPGVKNLPVEFRNGVDVMTTEAAGLSSVWTTDEKVREYYALHGREKDYAALAPERVAYYDGCVTVDLDDVEPMIALPTHPSNVYSIRELKKNAADILTLAQEAANRAFERQRVKIDLLSKLRDGKIFVDQGVIAGCAGGTFDNIAAAADILRGQSCGAGRFRLSVYPGSMPTYLALIKCGALSTILEAGGVVRECFCGPCFGAGDTPANGELSVRHVTRNFPSREGAKPGEGQIASVALMDARSIAATAARGGELTGADELTNIVYSRPVCTFDGSVYQKRVLNAVGRAEPQTPLVMGPNIKDWPQMPTLPQDLLLEVTGVIEDPVTTTDELIPSGETSAYRSNPLRLAEFTLSRRLPDFVEKSKAVGALNESKTGETLDAARAAFEKAGYPLSLDKTLIEGILCTVCPGDGSAREQAASCQRVLFAGANLARRYATKRYRSNLINWGMIPFVTEAVETLKQGDFLFVPGIRKTIEEGADETNGYLYSDGRVTLLSLSFGPLTPQERKILLAGCLINAQKNKQ